MHNNSMRKYLSIALVIGWAVTLAYFLIRNRAKEERLYQDKRVAMGTFVEVISPRKDAAKIVFAEITRIEDLLSKYNPDSEVSKLNRLGILKVSPEVFYVIKKSKEFCALTRGAFDITVGSLMDLWGFTDRDYALPSAEKIREALKLVGSDKIILREADSVVQFKVPGMKIDLGGIAKGYALDCAVKKLKEAGIKSCLLNAGGQVYCLGDRSGRPWRIALRDPAGRGKFIDYLYLKDRGVSTSGDYEQSFLRNNKIYGHIINPKTGYPAETGVLSVTVVTGDPLAADALSTAIFILGREEGEALASSFKDTRIIIAERK